MKPCLLLSNILFVFPYFIEISKNKIFIS
jgi:hypothetical protein